MQTVLGIEIIRQEYYYMFKTNDLRKNRLQSNNHAYCRAISRETYLQLWEICNLAKKSRSADQTSHLHKLKYQLHPDQSQQKTTRKATEIEQTPISTPHQSSYYPLQHPSCACNNAYGQFVKDQEIFVDIHGRVQPVKPAMGVTTKQLPYGKFHPKCWTASILISWLNINEKCQSMIPVMMMIPLNILA